MKAKLFWAIVLVMGSHLPLSSQTTHQNSYWFRVYARGAFQEKWSWHLEVDERRLVQPDRQFQFIAHGHLHRKIGNYLELSAGGSHSIVNDLPEWRLFQAFHFKAGLGQKWQVGSRLRTEQRWLRQEDNTWKQKFRWRHQVQLDWIFWKGCRVKLSDEWMWQSVNFDQHRLSLSTEWRMTKRISFEIGYLKIYQKQKENAKIDRDVLRTTIYLNL